MCATQRQLALSWRVGLGTDAAELQVIHIRCRPAEDGAVEQVESLATKINPEVFLNGEGLGDADVFRLSPETAELRVVTSRVAKQVWGLHGELVRRLEEAVDGGVEAVLTLPLA